MLTLNDGRKELYQWDTGRTATVDIYCDVVHFANLKYGESLAVEVKEGKVAIPNKSLMSGEPIYCWAFVADVNGNYTKQEQTLNVNKRAKPSDYVYNETETLTWKSLDKRITELEKGGPGGSDAVKYTKQELTDEQKMQARANIGAVSADELPEQVQVDHSQNDRTKHDFIKNRTHYQYTLGDIGYPVEFMDGTHNVGDIVLLRDSSKNVLNRFYIPGINAPYTETQALYLKFKVTYSGETHTIDRECKDTVVSDGSPIIEINKISSGNIKALYYSYRQPYIAWYFIADLTTLNDEDKTAFTKTGIYAQVVNDLDSASSIQIGCYIKQYVKLDSKYIDIPTATSDAPGVVKPVSKTDEMTQAVGVDENGALFTVPPGGSGVTVDDTLTISGAAADAKATGDQIRALSEEMLTEESDPTVPAWAKAAQKPSYTASEVGADPSGTAKSKVAAHNTGTDTHSDIRLLIQGLSERLSAVADSDDTTLDQLSEIVAYIKSNKSLIDAITTDKVSVSDIIDNLTTSASNKPLSAAQGVALKALIDSIVIPDKLPNPNALTFIGAVAGSYDGSAAMSVEIPGGGGGSGWELVSDTTLSEDVSQLEYTGLDCYDLRVAIHGRWNDANDSLSNANINANILLNETGNGYQYDNGQIGYIRPSGLNYHTLIEATAANALYPKVVVSLLPTGVAVNLKNQQCTFESLNYGNGWIGGKTAKINKIIITPAKSGVMLKSGSKIIVMKRN